jgi:Flp pilus assembly protein TadD
VVRSAINGSLLVLTAALLGPAPAPAQTGPGAPAAGRSHVERFSTPEMLAERAEAEAERKLAADPNDVEALDARALARMRRGRYAEAHEDLKRAVALKPRSAELRASLGYVLWRVGRTSEAIAAEREALKLDEKNFTANYQLGRFLLRTGDPKHLPEVTTLLARAVELDPRQYDVRFELIEAFRRTNDMAQALAQLDLLQDARPADPRVTYVAAILAADRGDIEAAIAGFQKALRQDANLYGVRQDLGLAYVRLGRWKEAVEVFSELVRRQPDSVESAYLHALALFNTGQGREAEGEARRALRLNAGAAEAHSLLGIILASRGGGNAEAVESLQQAAALDASNFDARFYLGRVLYAGRDYEGAARSLREAAALKPKHAEARFFLGTVLEAAGDSAGALAEYRLLAAAEPESAYGLLGTGALLVKQGKLDDALAALSRAVALAPADFEAHLALGRAHALKEQFNEAVAALERAVALAPDRADAHYQLGLALRRLGRTEEAAREFKTVDRLNTEFRTSARP